MRIDKNVMVPMRDGVKLATDLFFPEGSEGPWPVIQVRTPYDKNMNFLNTERLTQDGYVLAIQDVRGRFESEGNFRPLQDERLDGADMVGWLREQSWCNGKVATASGSYVGATQWLPALEQPEGMVTAMPQVTGSTFNGFGFYTRGVVQLDIFMLWSAGLCDDVNDRAGRTYADDMPKLKAMRDAAGNMLDLMLQTMAHDPASPEGQEAMQNLMGCIQEVGVTTTEFISQPLNEAARQVAEYAPWFADWIANVEDPDADFWRSMDWEPDRDNVDIPILHLAAWHDLFIRGQLKDFAALAARKDGPFQKIIVIPEIHTGTGNPAVTPIGEKLFPVTYAMDTYTNSKHPPSSDGNHSERWLQHWVKGEDTGLMNEAPITLYVQGDDIWRDEHEWPLARTQWTPLYLHSQGNANSVGGNGSLSFDAPKAGASEQDTFRYDPANPVLSKGGTFLNLGIPPGLFDQSEVEARDDVLVYTTDILETDLEVTGPVAMKLWAATSAVDTDFTAKLVDVDGDGKAMNVCDGVTRLRYRKSKPGLVTPGDIQDVEIELSPTSYVFKAGHRIRLQVSSSNFPLIDPNPNTGRSLLADESNEMIVANQTVFHSNTHPSHLILPVIPR